MYFINMYTINLIYTICWITAVAQWARAFASQAEGWVFESQPRQT